MKKLVLKIFSVAVFAVFISNAHCMSPASNVLGTDTIHVWSSPDLLGVTENWVEAFKMQNPDAKVEVIDALSAQNSNQTSLKNAIGIVSKEKFSSFSNSSNWSMVVGRDVVVPVMNAENPYKDNVFKTGVTLVSIANILSSANNNWGQLLNNSESEKTTCYFTDDKSVGAILNNLGTISNKLPCNGIVINKTDLIKKIQENKYAIGFCKLSDIIDSNTQQLHVGLSFIPIDANSNHKLDHFENIYSNVSDLTRGIWIGKYPKELYSRIFVITSDKPYSQSQLVFLEWLINDGQKILTNNGFTGLVPSEFESKSNSLQAYEMSVSELKAEPKQSSLVLIVLAIGTVIVLMSFFILKYFGSKEVETETSSIINPSVFNENTVEIPAGLFFDKTHTWAFMEKEGLVRVGIDDFMQHITGVITRVKLKNKGKTIKKGEVLVSISQYGKKLDIYSPVSGIIRENNTNLFNDATLLNKAPYSLGWVYVIESVNWMKELKSFAMAEPYKDWLKGEFIRLKDFLSATLNTNEALQVQWVMQEGGELKDNPVEGCGPEFWEEFQTGFIDNLKDTRF